MILKVTTKQSFTLSSDNIIFEIFLGLMCGFSLFFE